MSVYQDELQRNLNAPWQKGQIVGGARQGADFNRLGGGFGQANTDSMKHTFGRIAQNFDHTPAGLNALTQDEEFRRLFPNARLDKDWIDFGGQVDPHTGTRVGKIDVMHAWDPTNNSGKNWQWLTEEDALGGSQPSAQRQGNPIGSAMPGQQSDLMAMLLESLSGPQQSVDPQMLLLQQLMA